MAFALYGSGPSPRRLLTVLHPSDDCIRNAVRECLARCYAGNAPLVALAEYVTQLREQGWSQDDVRAVELSVRKVLVGLVVDDD